MIYRNDETLKVLRAERHDHGASDHNPAFEFGRDRIGERTVKPTWQYHVNIRRKRGSNRRRSRLRAWVEHAAF